MPSTTSSASLMTAASARRISSAAALWVEANQDAAYSYTKYRQLLETVPCRLQDGFAIAEHRLGTRKVRQVGRGQAVYLNLSPQRYLQYREEGTATDAQRAVFLGSINPSGRPPRVVVTYQGRRPPHCEVTYWSKSGRTYVFVLKNLPVNATTTGGGGVARLNAEGISIDVELPTAQKVVDERTGKVLGDGKRFSFRWNGVEPVFFSYAGGD